MNGVNTVRFTVHGEAIPQGSAKGFKHPSTGRVVVTHDNKRTKPWRADVGAAAREAIGNRGLLTGAVALNVVITRTRPKGHYGARGLRPSAPRWPTTRPDIDKLDRAILDALTNVIYRDDCQVVELHTNLRYLDDATVAPETIVTAASLEREWT